MARYLCTDRVPPDVMGRTYYEGETYLMDTPEIDKLTKAGHFGTEYSEPHFVEVSESGQAIAAALDDQLEALTKDALVDLAAQRGVSVDGSMKKADIIAAIRAADGK